MIEHEYIGHVCTMLDKKTNTQDNQDCHCLPSRKKRLQEKLPLYQVGNYEITVESCKNLF